MPPQAEVLGTLMPVGGGDPIPLLKPELIIGRRGSNRPQLQHARFKLTVKPAGKVLALMLASGIGFGELCVKLLEDAAKNFKPGVRSYHGAKKK